MANCPQKRALNALQTTTQSEPTQDEEEEPTRGLYATECCQEAGRGGEEGPNQGANVC